jgi:DNA-binding CsgD family transcriptional regulator/PAS domain-containing protein
MERSGADVIEQWGGEQIIRTLPLDQPAILSRVNPAFDPTTTRNRYYLDFAKPQGLIDVMAIGLARDEKGIGSLSFGRHERAGSFGEREIEVARLLVPHVQRAATINRLLDHVRVERDSFSGAIDALAQPVLLVGAALSILHANEAAERMLSKGRIALRENSRLRIRSPGATHALTMALASIRDVAIKFGRKGLGIPLRTPAGPLGSVYVLPVGRHPIDADDISRAAIFFTDINAAFVPPEDMAASLFDLTPSEVRVFNKLVAGCSLAETAKALNVATSTAKTQMLSIHAKMGIKRRADLVRIAAAINPPVIH